MVLVHASLGYSVCLECHAVCEGECTDTWIAEHTHHDDDATPHRRNWFRRA